MKSVILGWCLAVLVLSDNATHANEVLIKAEEAALPRSTHASRPALITRAITRAPDLTLVSPKQAVNSPFVLQFKFEPHGGSSINPESFKLVYLKDPVVDLTARVRPHVSAKGVRMADAEAPPGQHSVEARISDSDGRQTTVVFVLDVSQ